MDKDLKRFVAQHDREVRVTTNEFKIVIVLAAIGALFILSAMWFAVSDHMFMSGMSCTVLCILAGIGIAARAIAERITK